MAVTAGAPLTAVGFSRPDAGVVDQHIQLLDPINDGPRQPRDLAQLGQVGDHAGRHLKARSADLAPQPFQPRRIASMQNEPNAVVSSQPHSKRATEPIGSPGDRDGDSGGHASSRKSIS